MELLMSPYKYDTGGVSFPLIGRLIAQVAVPYFMWDDLISPIEPSFAVGAFYMVSMLFFVVFSHILPFITGKNVRKYFLNSYDDNWILMLLFLKIDDQYYVLIQQRIKVHQHTPNQRVNLFLKKNVLLLCIEELLQQEMFHQPAEQAEELFDQDQQQ
ncbi:unnamed protein product [Paramecium sonneborni]|uniref:Uncharacterized protein n=1 Tax=Paramecium sonneborni TaxID=65129 RepID=A0A8S1RSE8_9CILI|nr:unnamed protein product [Paramecium sonneborni]